MCRLDTADGGAQHDDVTPKSSNVRTRVHEYGGGAVTFGSGANQLYFSEFATQQLCQLVVVEEEDAHGVGRELQVGELAS